MYHTSSEWWDEVMAAYPNIKVVGTADAGFTKEGGLKVMEDFLQRFPAGEIDVVRSDYSDMTMGAIEAIKTGAEEYLAKPFTDEELFEAVRRALDKRSRRRIAAPAADSVVGPLPGFIGQSGPMQQVYAAVRKAAETIATVLITGESGTGKELVARAIHYSSRRSAAPFVAVNCGGIPEGLIESELFGHMKGAFTGAVTVTSSKYGKRYEMGRFQEGNTTLYVSRGIGMEGKGAPRMRFLCPPEIEMFELRGE